MSIKYLDNSGLSYFWGKVSNIISGKVDKVNGKGLSTEDYTTAEQTKLSGIATGAEVNVIESVSVNNTAQTITSKNVNISLDKTSVGLGNVDNTADANKSVNYATTAGIANQIAVNPSDTTNLNIWIET